ncbi:MAG: methionine--tRNA ligase subunit beta [Candidatus Omnitrophica bacterium]|nr:methionine--tRNA ligase subunit beta [Candidatus Omnitrophota bacterium]
MDTVSFEEFKKLSIKICRIKEVKDHPNADKLYILKIDIGGEEREVVAGIKMSYKPEELKDKLVAFVENIAPATIRGVESRGMVLAAQDNEKIVVISPDKDIAPGSKVK